LTLSQGIIGRRRTLSAPEREPEIQPLVPKGVAVPLVPVTPRPPSSETQRQPGVAVPIVPQVGPAPLARLRSASDPLVTAAKAEGAAALQAVAASQPMIVASPAAGMKAEPDEATRRFGLDPKRFPLLSQLGKNLCLAAARGELDPVIGRDAEI